jgi:hypothetical protein
MESGVEKKKHDIRVQPAECTMCVCVWVCVWVCVCVCNDTLCVQQCLVLIRFLCIRRGWKGMTLTLRVRVAKLQKTWNGGGSTSACRIIYSSEQGLAERIQSRTNLYWSLCFGLNLKGRAVNGASVECKLALCLAGSKSRIDIHTCEWVDLGDRQKTNGKRERGKIWMKKEKRETRNK